MDTKFLALILALALATATAPGVVAEEDLVCQKGVSGFPGATFPRGDILLREGDDLLVTCRLDMSKAPYNASFIRFQFTKTAPNFNENSMSLRVLNESAAELRVTNMSMSSPHLSCVLLPPDGGRAIQVCQNEIDVGYPPLPVLDFSCVAPEWRSLNCSWKKQDNPIPTNYALQILTKSKVPGLMVSYCPNTTATPTSCIWGPRTEPFYRQNLNPLRLRVNGSNVLKPEGVTWDYVLDHWAIVIPEVPHDLKVEGEAGSSKNISINWGFENFKDFTPGLNHQVFVCILNSSLPCNVTKLTSTKGIKSLSLSLRLDYAYTNYSIAVRMKSQKAADSERFWSQNSTAVFTSETGIPPFPPKVGGGSYESLGSGRKSRDIYIYWESIDRLHQSGPGFRYLVSVAEDEEKREMEPEEVSHSYARFTGLAKHKSYKFQIIAANDLGNSSSFSTIYVPKEGKAPPTPTAVSKLDFTNGSLAVSWAPVNWSLPIVSYTVFRCSSSKPRPYQCQGVLRWDEVAPSASSIVYDNVAHEDVITQFAVAANGEGGSSGMAWASCTLIHNKLPEKLRRVEVKGEGESEIRVQWVLDCSYKPGLIQGFKVSYCPVSAPHKDKCSESEKSEAVMGASATKLVIKKLAPCSSYLISVSILTPNGESPRSEPILGTTKQGAPSSAPSPKLLEVTNTSATLSIKPGLPLNGAVSKYLVFLKAEGEREPQLLEFKPHGLPSDWNADSGCSPDPGSLRPLEVELKYLRSQTNYSFTVSTCTVKCSPQSPAQTFTTKIGATNLTDYPILKTEGNLMVVEWEMASASAPNSISRFELLVKQNGEEGELSSVDFIQGMVSYRKEVEFSCSSDTNLTAAVRAVSQNEDGVELFGEFSPPATFTCGGSSSWAIWVGVVVGILVVIGMVGFGSTMAKDKWKGMQEVGIKVPPGLQVQELNGSFPGSKRRRDSGGDTESLGALGLTTFNHGHGHGHGREEEEGELREFVSLSDAHLNSENVEVEVEAEEAPTELEIQNESSSPLLEHQAPVPTSEPGISSSPSSSPGTSSSNSNSSSSPSCPPRTGPAPAPAILPSGPAIGQSYVRWGQLEGQGNPGNSQALPPPPGSTTPYCQVGILLHSN